jgi:thiosulfate/3-mercaptopyruvate sulfurtransferase
MSKDLFRLNRREVLLGAALLGATASRTTSGQETETPYLVDATWLSSATGAIYLLDLSELRTYRNQHIPGAVHGWWQDTMERDDPLYGTVLQPVNSTDQVKRLKLLESLGIADEQHIVAYDDDRGRWAAHFVWFLRFLGHDRASVLDGGLDAWTGNGGSTESGENDPPSSPVPAIAPRTGYYLNTAELIEQRNDPTTLVVDVRTDDEAADTINDSVPTGRIPGSILFPWTTALQESTSLMKSPADLGAAFAAAGLSPDRPVVVYARFGVEAAHTWLALEIAGYPNAVIYDRGWVGWVTESGLPYDPL